MYTGTATPVDKSDISYPRKKNKRYNESGRIKLGTNQKNMKNYNFLQKAYGFHAMPYNNAFAKDTHRQIMLNQNKGNMNYVVCFPNGSQPYVKPVRAKVSY